METHRGVVRRGDGAEEFNWASVTISVNGPLRSLLGYGVSDNKGGFEPMQIV